MKDSGADEVRASWLKRHYVHIRLTPVCDSSGDFLHSVIRGCVTLLHYIIAILYLQRGTYCSLTMDGWMDVLGPARVSTT